MRFHLSIFTLLCIVSALPAAHAEKKSAEPAEEGIACELLLEQFKTKPIPRARLQKLYQKAIVKAQPGEEQKLLNERAKLVTLYDAGIARLEERIEELKRAFKNEYHWRERANFFSGVRLVIAHEIAVMEMDLREMRKERNEVFRLIPRANVLVRAVRAIREQMNQGRDSLVRSATGALAADTPEDSSDAKFLNPMNPASPYYNLPIGPGHDEDKNQDKN